MAAVGEPPILSIPRKDAGDSDAFPRAEKEIQEAQGTGRKEDEVQDVAWVMGGWRSSEDGVCGGPCLQVVILTPAPAGPGHTGCVSSPRGIVLGLVGSSSVLHKHREQQG